MSNKEKTAGMSSILVFIAMFYVALMAIKAYLNLPVVHVSHTTHECVAVETIDGPGDCDDLPEKYAKVWVQ